MNALTALNESGAFVKKGKGAYILQDLTHFAQTRRFLTSKQICFALDLLQDYRTDLRKLNITLPEKAESVHIKQGSYLGTCNISVLHADSVSIQIKAPKDSPLLRVASRISGFRQHKENIWAVPLHSRNVYALVNAGFIPLPNIKHLLDHCIRQIRTPDFSRLKHPLKKYQMEGVSVLLGKDTGMILGDEQGLGKTAQAIAWAELAELPKVCVVCPASLKTNWSREITLWTGDTDHCVLSGKTTTKYATSDIARSKWIIVNYDILAAWANELHRHEISAFIFDEAQNLKNEKSKRTIAATNLAKGTRTLLLSGTPIENRPAEFLPIIRIADPLLFPSKTKFYERYCDQHMSKFGFMDRSGASNTQELHKILTDTILIRRKKKDVLAELPDKQRCVVPLSIPASKLTEYNDAERDFAAWLLENKPKKGAAKQGQLKAQAMIKISVLKRLAALAKLPLVIDWIRTYLENENKLVVFAIHKEVIQGLKKAFGEQAVVVDGSVPSDKRQALCDRFNNDSNILLFIGNIKAAGTGLTLVAAKNTLTVELAWTAAAHDQCEDRVHRIGQKNAVTSYYVVAENTVEEKVIKVLDNKRKVMSQVLDGQDPVDENLLDQLIKSYEGKDEQNKN